MTAAPAPAAAPPLPDPRPRRRGRRPTGVAGVTSVTRRSQARLGMALVAPAVLLMVVFLIFPVLNAVYYLFVDFDGIDPTPPFVGLANFAELAQDPEHVIVAFLGVVSEEQLEAELTEAEAELGSGQVGAEAIAAEEAEAADVEVGSESDAAGEGDVVGETEAPRSETPAE